MLVWGDVRSCMNKSQDQSHSTYALVREHFNHCNSASAQLQCYSSCHWRRWLTSHPCLTDPTLFCFASCQRQRWALQQCTNAISILRIMFGAYHVRNSHHLQMHLLQSPSDIVRDNVIHHTNVLTNKQRFTSCLQKKTIIISPGVNHFACFAPYSLETTMNICPCRRRQKLTEARPARKTWTKYLHSAVLFKCEERKMLLASPRKERTAISSISSTALRAQHAKTIMKDDLLSRHVTTLWCG